MKNIRSILDQNLDELADIDVDAAGSVAPFRSGLKPTTLHVKFQCNHYQPGEKVHGSEVMTAWALGPKDKAQVVHRFLIELEKWNRTRTDAYQSVQGGGEVFRKVEFQARIKLLGDRLVDLSKRYGKLLQEIETGFIKANAKKFQDEKKELHDRLVTLRTKVNEIMVDKLDRLEMKNVEKLNKLVEELGAKASGMDKLPAGEWWAALTQPVEFDKITNVAYQEQIQTSIKMLARPVDPQIEFDRKAMRTKELFEGDPRR